VRRKARSIPQSIGSGWLVSSNVATGDDLITPYNKVSATTSMNLRKFFRPPEQPIVKELAPIREDWPLALGLPLSRPSAKGLIRLIAIIVIA
jgi:hypothetical protein